MNSVAFAASKSSYSYPLFITELRPYQSLHIVVIFKLPSALGAD